MPIFFKIAESHDQSWECWEIESWLVPIDKCFYHYPWECVLASYYCVTQNKFYSIFFSIVKSFYFALWKRNWAQRFLSFLLTVECISSMASMHPVLSWLLIAKLDRSGNNNNDKNKGSHSAVNMTSRWPYLRPYPRKLMSKPAFLDLN